MKFRKNINFTANMSIKSIKDTMKKNIKSLNMKNKKL